MVKAIAPNAPIGAAFIRIATTLKTASDTSSSAWSSRSPRSPISARPMPNRIATNSVWRMLPAVSADRNVSGMMPRRKPVNVLSCALAAYSATLPPSSEAGSMFSPAPGRTTFATTSPTTRASVEKNRKYANALPATRPTEARSRMPAMPVTMVRKMTGAMIIFTSLMKASPSGFIASPVSGAKWPSRTPAAIATSTWT